MQTVTYRMGEQGPTIHRRPATNQKGKQYKKTFIALVRLHLGKLPQFGVLNYLTIQKNNAIMC